MNNKITFCIPSKNNLRYLKWSIPSIRKNSYYKDHEIIIFADSDNDGTIDWIKENKEKYNLKYIVNPNLNKELWGIGRAYDTCAYYAENDIIMAWHTDMYFGRDCDYHMLKHLDENKIICATRIEPPLHPEQPCKIVKDFGMWPEVFEEGQYLNEGSCDTPPIPRLKIDGFKEVELENFIEEQKILNKDKITHGIFAPWIINKKTYINMGGHDYIFHSAREDSDFFNRCMLAGMGITQSWEAFVYHLTCRAGQFQHGILTTEHSQKSKDWQILMENSSRDFIRKWGTPVKHDNYLYPQVSHKYNIGIVFENLQDYKYLQILELFTNDIYLKDENLVNQYIKNEQPNTKFDLKNRVHPIRSGESLPMNDIIITVNDANITDESIYILSNIADIITNSGSIGEFQLNVFTIKINKMETKENSYIINNESIFNNKIELPKLKK